MKSFLQPLEGEPTNYIDIWASYTSSEGARSLIRWDINVTFEADELRAYIYRQRYAIVRETKACFVIDDYGKERFVLKGQSGKRFAYLSDTAAIHSLKKRVHWRMAHANTAMQRAEAAMSAFNTRFDAATNELKL